MGNKEWQQLSKNLGHGGSLPINRELSRFLAIAGVLIVVAIFAWESQQARMSQEEIARLESRIARAEVTAVPAGGRIAKLNEEVSNLKSRLNISDFLSGLPGQVNLTKTNFQSIEEGFSVRVTNVGRHLSGVKITGSVLNQQGVTHEHAVFQVTVGKQKNEFTIRWIRPGFAAKFSVIVLDVKVEEARYAKFEYQRSLLSYYNE